MYLNTHTWQKWHFTHGNYRKWPAGFWEHSYSLDFLFPVNSQTSKVTPNTRLSLWPCYIQEATGFKRSKELTAPGAASAENWMGEQTPGWGHCCIWYSSKRREEFGVSAFFSFWHLKGQRWEAGVSQTVNVEVCDFGLLGNCWLSFLPKT